MNANERLLENLMIDRTQETIRSFAAARYIATKGRITEKAKVAIAAPIINPIAGITTRFVNKAMMENLLKYKRVNGSVPIWALIETAMNKIKYFKNRFLTCHFSINEFI